MSVLKPGGSLIRFAVPVLVLAATTSGHLTWAGPNSVPFKASVDTQEVLGFDLDRCPGTGILGTTTGSGNASHLGAVSMSGSDCPLLPYGVPSFSNGLLTLKAANGDELKASYQGALMSIGGSTTNFSIAGTFAVSGGTGRFLNASGAGSLQGNIILGPQVSKGQYQITGNISY